MLLPALLPAQFERYAKAPTELALFRALIKTPSDFLRFFEYACGDETWSQKHSEFMHDSITLLTLRFFQDNLEMDLALRAVKVLREHFSILEPYIPFIIEIIIEDQKVEINPLLLGTQSKFFRDLLRMECKDKNKKWVKLNEGSYEIIQLVKEFSNTGNVGNLWRKEKNEVLKIIHQATQWEIPGLVSLCEGVLERYIHRVNVIEMLLSAHQEHWMHLKKACVDFINDLNLGFQLKYFAAPDYLGFEFLDFKDNALSFFEQLRSVITHLIFSHSLTEEAGFSNVVNCCPNLICVDLSGSLTFSERLVDMPSMLQELDVSQCSWLDQYALKKIVEICPQLTKLSLRSNVQITHMGWGELLKLRQLKSLDLARCHQIDNDEFKIILRACAGLEVLNLEECKKITDKGFEELAYSIPKLTHLNLTRCTISDVALLEVATKLRIMTSLNLTRCEYLSEKGIIEAVKQSHTLRSLNLTHCNISTTGLEAIYKINPSLEMIT